MSTPNPNFDRIVEAINDNPFRVAHTLASLIAMLGSRPEWSMDDNFHTTEAIAALAERIGLPRAGDQDDEALAFYREACRDV